MYADKAFGAADTLQPTIASAWREALALATESTDEALLQLCASYLEAGLKQERWGQNLSALSKKQQAFIEFTERFMTAVGSTEQQQVNTLLQFASADDVYNFVNALYLTDMSLRLKLVTERILP